MTAFDFIYIIGQCVAAIMCFYGLSKANEKLEKEYETTKDETLFWDSIDNIKKQEYYLSELCGYSIAQHKPFGQYIDEKNMFKDNESTSDSDDDDLSWLNELLGD